MTENYPKEADIIIKRLYENSYEGFLVGGIVRDSLLKRKCHDIDITTNAVPSEVMRLFSDDFKVIDTGIKYGTVTVFINSVPVEVTTYRSEKAYRDGRRPENIEFETDIKKDLSRRDFTVNAMAYNKKEGLIDLFGGQEDIKNKIIRSVGDPEKRFEEDKLRMLRAIRFAAKLDFDIEENTFEAIKKFAKNINEISIERINQELTGILLTEKPSKAFVLMHECGLLKYILPEIDKMYGFDQKNPYHKKDLFFHTMEVLDNVDKDIELRLSALFHDVGKLYTMTIDEKGVGHFYGHNEISYEISKKTLKELKYSNETAKNASLLVKKHMIAPNTITKKGIRRILSEIGEENIHKLVNLQQADSFSTTIGKNDIFEKKVEDTLNEKPVFSKRNLDINGYDLMNMGFQGRKIGEILDFLFEKVLDDPGINQKEILISMIKENF